MLSWQKAREGLIEELDLIFQLNEATGRIINNENSNTSFTSSVHPHAEKVDSSSLFHE